MEHLDDSGPLFKSLVDLREPAANCNMARELIDTFKRHLDRVLLVDSRSDRKWTGSQLLDRCGRIASSLVRRAGIQVNDVVMTICDREDTEVLMAIGTLLAGAAIYPTTPTDGYNEAQILCELVQPQALLINSKYHERALRLSQEVAGMRDVKIIWVDDGCQGLSGKPESPMANRLGSSRNTNGGACPMNGKGHIDENNDDLKSSGQVISLASVEMQPLETKLIESIANEGIKNDEHICNYMLTSGSTGRPKVVPATHRESVWGLYSMISASTVPFVNRKQIETEDANNNNDSDYGASQKEYLLALSDKDVVAGDLPLDHGAGLNIMFLAFWLGAKYIVMPSFKVDFFWESVSSHKITFSMSSTLFCFKLFSHLKKMIDEGTSSRLDLSSITTIVCCGSKLSFVDLVREIQAHYPQITVSQSYGCTENGYVANLPKSDARDHIQSVGYLFPGIIAKIVDPNKDDKQLGAEKRGELLVWSPSLFKGYRCHPEVDADEIHRNCHDQKGVFYRTGDQAHFDREGRLYIHGRYKDTLWLMDDWKIMPAELEEVVNRHPLVETSAVVGMPDQNLPGCHKPRAFVKLVPKGAAHTIRQQLSSSPATQVANADELMARFEQDDLAFVAEHIRLFVADLMAPAKRLRGGVRILDELPRVGTLNKIDRNALKNMY